MRIYQYSIDKLEYNMKTSSKFNRAVFKRSVLQSCGAVLGVLLLGSAAQAAPFGGPGKHGPIDLAEAEAKTEERVAQRFASMDTNDNSKIELEEFIAAEPPRHMNRQMGHKQGMGKKMRQGEKGKMRRGMMDPELSASMRDKMQDEMFKLLDTDGNGQISATEFKNPEAMQLRREARKRAMFAQLDADGNGTLSLAEMPSRLAKLKAADTNADGKVTREELRSARVQARDAS